MNPDPSPSPSPSGPPCRPPAGAPGTHIVCAVLAVLTLAVFGRIVTHSYVIWDDQLNVYENPHFTGKSARGLGAFWSGSYEGLYIPVTYTVWSAIAAVAGESIEPEISKTPVLDPAPFHAANFILHLTCVFLVFRLLRILLPGADPFAAGCGAALFAIHPLQVEPVAWVTGMKDVLSAVFALGAAVLFLENSQRQRRAGRSLFAGPAWWAAFLLFLAALLSKPAVVMLPLVLLLFDGLLARTPWKTSAIALLPFLAAAAAVSIMTAEVQLAPDHRSGEFAVTDALPIHLRPIAALDALTLYLSKLVYPLRLATQYDRSPAHAVRIATQYPLWIAPLLFAALLLRVRSNRRFHLAGFGAAFLFLAPVLGFIPFGFLNVSTVADRYMYLPMAGVALALAASTSPSDRRLPRAVAALAIITFAWLSFLQAGVWKSPTTLFSHTYKINPRSVAAASNLGAAAMNTGRYEEALVHYKKLLTLNRDDPRAQAVVGHLHNETGQFAEAIPYLQKAIELDPNLAPAYRNLGISRFNLGEFDHAALLFTKSLELEPDVADVYINLGATLSNLKRYDEAIAAFQKAARLNPALWQPYRGMATVWINDGRFAEAVAALEKLIAMRPDDPEDAASLADAYAGAGERELAIAAAARAVQVAQSTPGFPPEKLRRYRDQLSQLQTRGTR